jgi:IS5 family transposase
VDSVSVRAKKKGELTGPSPTDRGKAGTKYHVLCDRTGLPLHVQISGANAHDSTMLAPLLDTNPGVRERRSRPGRPRRRPDKLHADKGYDYPRCRQATLSALLALACTLICHHRLP